MMPEARVARSISETEAAKLAHEIYNLEVRATRLPGEYDDNFHLLAESGSPRPGGRDGREFVLKVMHPARERSFIELQCAALQHLAQRAPQLSLPRVCQTKSGQFFAQAKIAGDAERFVWLLTYLPGALLAKVQPHTSELLESLGRFLGELDAALTDFSHPAANRELKWDLSRASWIRNHLGELPGRASRELAEKFLRLYETQVVPALPSLRRSVIYGDANDYNVLVSLPWPQPRKIAGLIDFGDMHHGITVSELAVAAAYAILGKDDPLQAAAQVAAGYHRAMPLSETEMEVLYPLIGMRLAVSVTNSAHRKALVPDDPYVSVSEAPAWEALEKWAKVHPRFAHYAFRAACGLTPAPQSEEIQRWLRSQMQTAAPLLDTDLRTSPCIVFDLSAGSTFLGADPKAGDTANLTESIFRKMKAAGARVGVGRYDEARLLYTSSLFGDRKSVV